MTNPNRAVFLDRDGTLNHDPGYLHTLDQLVFYPRVIDSLILLSEMNCKVIIVTNQPGIGRGYYSEKEYLKFEEQYLARLDTLSGGNINIDAIYYCPHHPSAGLGKYRCVCNCRKPEPGMLIRAQENFGLCLTNSIMIGDKRSDLAAGRAVGCMTILTETGDGGKGGHGCRTKPDHQVADLHDAAQLVRMLWEKG